jgi:hypothetical protein
MASILVHCLPRLPKRLPQRTIASALPTPGTVCPSVTLQIPLRPCSSAGPLVTSRSVQPGMVVGLVSGAGATFVALRICSALAPVRCTAVECLLAAGATNAVDAEETSKLCSVLASASRSSHEQCCRESEDGLLLEVLASELTLRRLQRGAGAGKTGMPLSTMFLPSAQNEHRIQAWGRERPEAEHKRRSRLWPKYLPRLTASRYRCAARMTNQSRRPRFARGYCLAGVGAFVPAAGFLSFCWTLFVFDGGFANPLKQLRRSSSSFTKRQSCTVLAEAETCFGSGFILLS